MKEIKKINEPFEHVIIDNFFSKDIFTSLIEEIKTLDLSLDATNGDFRCISRIDSSGKVIQSEGINQNILIQVFNAGQARLLDQLKKLAPRKHELYEFTELRIQKAQEAYSSGAHTDSRQKLLSCVVYLMPKNEQGTQMYKTKTGPVVAQCEWQQNRAFIFSRKENKTWHSWAASGVSGRYVLVFTLMTSRPKIALKSEGLISQIYAIRKNPLQFLKGKKYE